jgi:hypothetical protein
MPQMNTPVFITVWKCSKCQQELGRGGPKPDLHSCPFCGARFRNGISPVSFKSEGGGGAPLNLAGSGSASSGSSDEGGLSAPIIVVIVVSVLALMAGIGVAIAVKLRDDAR